MFLVAAGDSDGADKVADKLEELSVKENKDDAKTSDGQKEDVKAEEEKK